MPAANGSRRWRSDQARGDLIETDACGFYLLQQGLVAINIDGSGCEVLGIEVIAAGGDREQ